MFELEFSTDNAAFTDGAERESARILEDITQKLSTGVNQGKVRDYNGNTIGQWSLTNE